MQSVLTKCAALDKEIEQVNEEIVVLAGLMKACIQGNASKTLEQDAFDFKYNGLVKQYEKATVRLEKLKPHKPSVRNGIGGCDFLLNSCATSRWY